MTTCTLRKQTNDMALSNTWQLNSNVKWLHTKWNEMAYKNEKIMYKTKWNDKQQNEMTKAKWKDKKEKEMKSIEVLLNILKIH